MNQKKQYSYIQAFTQLFKRFPKSRKRMFWVLLVSMTITALLETLAVCVIAFFASSISDPEGVLTSKYISFARSVVDFQFLNSKKGIIAASALFAIIAVAIKNMVQGYVSYKRARFSAEIEAHFGEILLKGFLNLPYEWNLSQNSADIINAVLWRKYMGQQFIVPYLQMFNDSLMMLIMLMVLLVVQPTLSMVVILIIGGTAIFIYKIVRSRIDKMALAARDHDIIINKETTMAVHGIKDIKISLMQNAFVSKFKEQAIPLSKIIGLQIFYGELPVLLLETIGFVLLGSSICIMLFWTSNSTAIVTGTMALLAVIAWRALPALSRVVGSISKIRNALPYLSRQLEYLEIIEKNNDANNSGEIHCIAEMEFINDIRFNNVSFGYESTSDPVLQKIDFKIKKGSSIGIVGTSGTGKSTLVDLLTGLLRTSEGEILVDGAPLTKQNYSAWMKKIGYVSQSPYIYDGTLAENIGYGLKKDEVDGERVIQCCEMAAMGDFIKDLPDHVNSRIGERGTRLSGGQQQRVAIARALYSNPEIMIFDEATSSLDAKSESAIMETIYSLKGRQTLIIIAHRLSTVKDCDELVWLEKGKIRMKGNSKDVLYQYGNSSTTDRLDKN